MHRFLVVGAGGARALALSAPAGAWSWPADGAVLRPFALGSDAYAAGQHRGVDVAGPEGAAVRAPAAGTVTFAGSLPTHGRGVTILTADGYAVTLVHLGTIGVAKGASVDEGDVDRDDGVERDARARRAERPPRDPPRERRRRLRRPARAPPAPGGSRACADPGACPRADPGPCPGPSRSAGPARRIAAPSPVAPGPSTAPAPRSAGVRTRRAGAACCRRGDPRSGQAFRPPAARLRRPPIRCAGRRRDLVEAPREGGRASRSPRRAFRTDGRPRRPTRARAGPPSPAPVPPCPATPPPRPPRASEPVPAGAANAVATDAGATSSRCSGSASLTRCATLPHGRAPSIGPRPETLGVARPDRADRRRVPSAAHRGNRGAAIAAGGATRALRDGGAPVGPLVAAFLLGVPRRSGRGPESRP